MKIILSLLLAVLIYFSIPTHGAIYQGAIYDSVLSGSAINDSVLSGSAVEENNIININKIYLSNASVLFFAVNTKIDTSMLCNTASVISNEFRFYDCNIEWQSTDTIDTSSPGKIIIKKDNTT